MPSSILQPILDHLLSARPDIAENIPVLNRDGTLVGHTTGHAKRCRLEGCGSWTIRVRWPDSRITWPCLKGMRVMNRTYQIL